MKTIFNYCLATVVACVFIFYSCKKNSNEPDAAPTPTATQGDLPLTEAESDFLATVQDTFIHLEDIILEGGQNVRSFLQANDPNFLLTYPSGRVRHTTALSPKEQKNMYLARMFTMGNYLVYDPNHTHPALGVNEPAQTGLAYSWGSKDHDRRQVPPTKAELVPGCPGCNTLSIYGLDCTGMIWQMTKAAFLPPVQPKSNYFMTTISNANLWTNSFKSSDDYKDLTMEDKGMLAPNKIENGDMILWPRHIGVYIYGWIYQSNGTPCAPGCGNNLNLDKGPQCLSLAQILAFGLGNYKVFRPAYPDYEITFAFDATAIATNGGQTGNCNWTSGSYIDSARVYFSVKNNIVTLDKIVNITPTLDVSSGGCTCTGVTFLNNGGVIEFNAFSGTVSNDSIFSYDWTYVAGQPTESYQCTPPALAVTYDGVNYTVNEVDVITLPALGQEHTYPWANLGTLTIRHGY